VARAPPAIVLVGIVVEVVELRSGCARRRTRSLVRRRPASLGSFERGEQAARPDRAEGSRRIVERLPTAGARQRGIGGVEARPDLAVDQRPHDCGKNLVVGRQGAVALHGEIAPGQGRPAAELPHDARLEAPGGEERGLHAHHPDLLGRCGPGIDEHSRAVGPGRLAGAAVGDLERAPPDRRRQQPEPIDALVAG
jgi:hypothetical protein